MHAQADVHTVAPGQIRLGLSVNVERVRLGVAILFASRGTGTATRDVGSTPARGIAADVSSCIATRMCSRCCGTTTSRSRLCSDGLEFRRPSRRRVDENRLAGARECPSPKQAPISHRCASDEQIALRYTVRPFLAKKASIAAHVRPMLEDPAGTTEAVWRGLAELRKTRLAELLADLADVTVDGRPALDEATMLRRLGEIALRITYLEILGRPHLPDHDAHGTRHHPAYRPRRPAAEAAIKTWSDDVGPDANDKAAHVRAVARAEFGRKGYEVTTIRDIASAAGLGTGTVYRLIGSKDELRLDRGVVRDKSRWVDSPLFCAPTPLRSRSWMRSAGSISTHWTSFPTSGRSNSPGCARSPPDTPNPGLAFTMRLRQLRTLLSEGIQSGDVRIEDPPSLQCCRAA